LSRNRIVVVLACVLALGSIGLLGWWLFARRVPASSGDWPERLAASSDARPAKQKRLRSRPAGRLVFPHAQAERSSGASIAGRVVDDRTGRGVPSAALTFLRARTAFGADAATDGSFVLEGLEPGVYELNAISAPGYASFQADLGRGGITLRVDADTRLRDVTFSLRALWFTGGTVIDPTGAPVAGALVHDLEGDERTTTDGEGHFDIGCSLGAVLEARHERFAPGRAVCDRSAELGRPISIRLAAAGTAGARGSIAGRVVGADGRGIEGALVSAERRDGPHSTTLVSEVPSGADGRFSLDALEAGPYDVSASAEPFATAVASGVRTGERELVLRLVAGGSLRGIVRERESAQPIAGFSIVLWPMRGALERGSAIVRTLFAPDGSFVIAALPPGDYSVTALSAGWPSADERRVVITAGATAEVLLELAPGGRVHGTVHDQSTGKPIPGAQVALESTLGDERSAVPLLASSTSDESGAFELRGIGAERFSLAVSAAEHHHKLLTGLTLRVGRELGPLRVELEPTAPGEAPKLELHGIGAVLRVQGDAVIVADVVAESGAARAGLAPGDRILAVDGVPVASLGFKGTIEHIRGPEGTAVRLRIRRGDTETDLVAERRRVRR
jgi:protocatechuate 3,4-dioxygenase beta subunit